MALGWKVLIPLSIVWILLIATIKGWRNAPHGSSFVPYLVVLVLVFILIVLLVGFWDTAAQKHAEKIGPQEPVTPETQAQAAEESGGQVRFPVPPLDLPHYHGVTDGGPVGDTAVTASANVNGNAPKEVTGAGN
jgi:NADH-quinone oxidoreductase subunit H